MSSAHPNTRIGGFGILNLTAGVRDHSNRVSLELFVNNFLDRHYYAGLGQDSLATGLAVTGGYARDSFRYGGLRLNAHF